jgi:hypothetical protein
LGFILWARAFSGLKILGPTHLFLQEQAMQRKIQRARVKALANFQGPVHPPGIGFTRIHFGRKLFGQIFFLQILNKFTPKNVFKFTAPRVAVVLFENQNIFFRFEKRSSLLQR